MAGGLADAEEAVTDEDDAERELSEELELGHKAELELCWHLWRMGASALNNKVELVDPMTGDLLYYDVKVELEGRIKNPKVDHGG